LPQAPQFVASLETSTQAPAQVVCEPVHSSPVSHPVVNSAKTSVEIASQRRSLTRNRFIDT